MTKPFYVLGLTASSDRLDGAGRFGLPSHQLHDTAAVLLRDGEVVAALEQERADRIKHSNQLPLDAIALCLARAGIALADVDVIAVGSDERNLDARFAHLARAAGVPFAGIRAHLAMALRERFGPVDADRLAFLPHHLAHAASAHLPSGFDQSLTVVIDGGGDGLSGLVCRGDGVDVIPLRTLRPDQSLGELYIAAIKHIGYDLFDEYKVMGLAPYGRGARFRAAFERVVTLLPGGDFRIDWDAVAGLGALVPRRDRGGPFLRPHRDFAAALQEALERVALHLIEHFRQQTGLRHLCLAGGVAHNCTMNGKLLASGWFDDVFVQPAAHDAGNALGAAVYEHHKARAQDPARLSHVLWGTDIAEADVIAALDVWSDHVVVEQLDDVVDTTARLLARGEVLGWVQGRSEFGPRALGNRSILADPRPRENREVINHMVKKREGYRPLAPAVLADAVHDYFVVPPGATHLGYMNFVVPVAPRHRRRLGAVTHVDGSARVQTVDDDANPRFAALLRAFRAQTGVPILLNTSFNNRHEPIVDTAHDAITCLLTTRLHGLVIGDRLVRRRRMTRARKLALRPAWSPYATLDAQSAGVPHRTRVPLSAATVTVLGGADGRCSLGGLLDAAGHPTPATHRRVLREVDDLWARRLLTLRP
jgi:carbamoyltransferase